MTNERILNQCKEKEQEQLDRYFSGIGTFETVSDDEKDLPFRVKHDYYEFLGDVWRKYAPGDSRTIDDILDEQKLRKLMTDDNREEVDATFEKAKTRTLWERLVKSNHRDVRAFRNVLEDYTRDLLLVMRCDFLEEVTGNYIHNKAFEDK